MVVSERPMLQGFRGAERSSYPSFEDGEEIFFFELLRCDVLFFLCKSLPPLCSFQSEWKENTAAFKVDSARRKVNHGCNGFFFFIHFLARFLMRSAFLSLPSSLSLCVCV